MKGLIVFGTGGHFSSTADNALGQKEDDATGILGDVYPDPRFTLRISALSTIDTLAGARIATSVSKNWGPGELCQTVSDVVLSCSAPFVSTRPHFFGDNTVLGRVDYGKRHGRLSFGIRE